MIISLALVLFATACGVVATYLYDPNASFITRLCAGVCTGIAGLGLICFVFALFFGLTAPAIILSLVVLAIPLITLNNPIRRQLIQKDAVDTYRTVSDAVLHPGKIPFGYFSFYLFTAVILWFCFQRAMIEVPDGYYTGLLNNFGDLPFHISVVTSFAFGNNYPPQDPTYAGVKFTYPFITDFISAIFVKCGASIRQSMFLENYPVALAFVGLLHRWAFVLLRNRLAAVITPVLVILNGGLGWVMFTAAATDSHDGFVAFLKSLPVSFTIIPESTWRWGNAISTLLIPQRGFLLGLPLGVIVFTQWWMATNRADVDVEHKAAGTGKRAKRKKRTVDAAARSLLPTISPTQQMIGAGIIAGLLPLVHAHSFVVVMVVGAGIAMLQRQWRHWFVFFVTASVIALPQMLWSTHGSAVDSAKFFEWHLGWDHGTDNPVWFWLKNTGLFIPLTIAALLWRDQEPLVSRRLLVFFLPFTLCFIVPNVLKMAPWIWDNIKVLYYWWLASAPLVALFLSRLWEKGGLQRAAAVLMFIIVIAAGGLDVASILFRPTKHQVFDRKGIQFAEAMTKQTAPRALVMHAPVHNHPVFLTGRRSLMGYPGHIWTHGLDYVQRESEIKRVYSGAPDADSLLRRYGIAYVVVGPHERNIMLVNETFFSKFEVLGDVGGYRLYKVAQK
ncbi:MAG TPA: hypothetical protein VJV03_18400 [Pyrinomonadaceae bacterium]|nr:hypothetical protein [Pyrinomonadaceae bacterium]